jgi:acetyl esterase/lipase
MSGGPEMPMPRGARTASATVGGIAGEWVTADGVPTIATLLYLHGGGYFACTPQTHRPVTASFALAGFRTFCPDYRLAPEHPFPAGLEDAVAAYRGLLQDHAPHQLVIAGDSAGGGLCMALLLSLREQGIPHVRCVVLIEACGCCARPSSRIRRSRCAMFTNESFGRAAQYYLGDRDRCAPLASPLYADLQGLPPLLIHVGTDETLLDDSRRLAERAQRAGVRTQLKIWPAVPHVWQLFQRWIPEGRSSLREAGMFFAREVGTAGAR